MKKRLLVVFVALFFSSAAFCQLKEDPFPYSGKKPWEPSEFLKKKIQGDSLSDEDILNAFYYGDTDVLNSFSIDRYLRSKYQGREFLSLSVFAALNPAWPNHEYFRSLAMKLIKGGVDVNSCPEYSGEGYRVRGVGSWNEGASFRWCAWIQLLTTDRYPFVKNKSYLIFNHKDPIFAEMFKRAKNIPFPVIDIILQNSLAYPCSQELSRKGTTEYMKYVLQNAMNSYSNSIQALKNFLRSSDLPDAIAEFYLTVIGDDLIEERFRPSPDSMPHPSAAEEGIKAWYYIQQLYLKNGIPLPDTDYVKRMEELLNVNKIPA